MLTNGSVLRRYLFLLVFLVPSSVLLIHAQTETPTLNTPYATATVAPAYSCPELPVNPDAVSLRYQKECSACLGVEPTDLPIFPQFDISYSGDFEWSSSTPDYVPTYWQTLTPTATPTEIPIATSTNTPTATPLPNYDWEKAWDFVASDGASDGWTSRTIYNSDGSVYCGSTSVSYASGWRTIRGAAMIDWVTPVNIVYYAVDGYREDNLNGTFMTAWQDITSYQYPNAGNPQALLGNVSGSFAYTSSDISWGDIRAWSMASCDASAAAVWQHLTLRGVGDCPFASGCSYPGGFQQPTPIPTNTPDLTTTPATTTPYPTATTYVTPEYLPSPTPYGDVNCLAPEDYPPFGYSDMSNSLEQVTLPSSVNCIVLIPEINLSDLNASLYFSGLETCFVFYTLPVLNLFGIPIPLGALIASLVGFLFIRLAQM